MTNNLDYHIPVMLQECIDALSINPDGVYVDVTFGGGGHSRAIFEKLSPKGRLIAFDQDPDARKNAWDAPNFDLIPANFAFLSNHLRLLGIKEVDGLLADLGVSSHQFDEDTRGFSIRTDAKLDMRMNQQSHLTAEGVVNNYEEKDLLRIFRAYGEIKNAYRLAQAIITERRNGKIKTTHDLIQIGTKCAPKHKENRYLAQVFQAIRIEVNDEMHALEKLLEQSADVLKPKGRLVVMSYHSLEDRLVKNYTKRGSLTGEIEKDFYGNVLKPFTEIVRHPRVPSDEEIERNSRARSAKLRIAERNG
ncbi:MAG: 16S rRNA (cytosine(1402)-N(4))-methyltransferase RsmH [Crocinitomicaceae bacterium]|nr:16S rRNA (cytosine(1402)-N(4))-methyltransferase RsmH [Crocinitomicaceae bacterium]